MHTDTSVTDKSDSMIEYGLRWHRFGGGPAEDIARTFQMTPTWFFHELEQALLHNRSIDLPSDLVVDMLRVCRLRIWLGN